MDQRAYGKMHGLRMDRRTHGWIIPSDRQMPLDGIDGWDGWDGWMHEWMNERTVDGWIDGWMDDCMHG